MSPVIGMSLSAVAAACVAATVVLTTSPSPALTANPRSLPSSGTPATSAATPPGSAKRAPSDDPGALQAPEPVEPGTEPATLLHGTRRVEVADDDAFESALKNATPGDVIVLAAGRYQPVEITRSGTAAAPITVTGPTNAVVTGDESGYSVHLDDASYWQLVGFGVSGGGKGIMIDGGGHNVLDSLTIGRTADEAVHFRSGSSDNVIQRSHIHDTGLDKPEFGEGVYVGSAKSNWSQYGERGGPDLANDNRVLDNTFTAITAENVDIKEETEGTVVARNHFDGSGLSGQNYADSVVDLKGYASKILDNLTTGNGKHLVNIIETHVITDPSTSGCGNTIEGNRVEGFTPAGAMVAIDRKCG